MKHKILRFLFGINITKFARFQLLKDLKMRIKVITNKLQSKIIYHLTRQVENNTELTFILTAQIYLMN